MGCSRTISAHLDAPDPRSARRHLRGADPLAAPRERRLRERGADERWVRVALPAGLLADLARLALHAAREEGAGQLAVFWKEAHPLADRDEEEILREDGALRDDVGLRLLVGRPVERVAEHVDRALRAKALGERGR